MPRCAYAYVCVCVLWEEWSLTEETWPSLSYGNLRVSQSHHKTASLSDPTSFALSLAVSNPLPGHTHSCLMKDDVCCHCRFKDTQRGLRSKKKRTRRENFHLSPHMKALLTQSQGFGRPGVFRKTLMAMDGANEKRRRKRRREGIRRGAEKRGK